jgi:hypothetical protein
MMWSLTSPRANRISGLYNFRSSPEKDFFNTIGKKSRFLAAHQMLPTIRTSSGRGEVSQNTEFNTNPDVTFSAIVFFSQQTQGRFTPKNGHRQLNRLRPRSAKQTFGDQVFCNGERSRQTRPPITEKPQTGRLRRATSACSRRS